MLTAQGPGEEKTSAVLGKLQPLLAVGIAHAAGLNSAAFRYVRCLLDRRFDIVQL